MADIRTSDGRFTEAGAHQVRSLSHKFGRACDGKSVEVIGCAVSTFVAAMLCQVSETEQGAQDGLEAMLQDIRNAIALNYAKQGRPQ